MIERRHLLLINEGTLVEKLTEEVVKDAQHLRCLIATCEAQRQVGETSLNDRSSRSHQIIKLIWCYEHIIIGRPKLLHSIFPQACRWESSPKRYVTSPENNIKFEELEHTQILWKLQPTSQETLIDIIREIPKEWYLRTGPGTIEQPIEVQSGRTIRRVRVYREEEEELMRQQKSVIFLLSDDEESQETENLQEEILEERIENDDGLRKRLEDENDELRKKVEDEEELRRRVEAENVELRNQIQYEKEVMKTLQDEIEELKNSVKKLCKENRLLDGCFSDLDKVLSNDNVDL